MPLDPWQCSECLHKPKLLIDLFDFFFFKLFELLNIELLFLIILKLLAINHSSSERRDIFVPRLLKLSHVLVVLQLAWVLISWELSSITRSGLVPFPGCQIHVA